jgi:hypothetical protein
MLIACFSATAFGCGQIPDKIIYKGKKYQLLHSFPMESYFKKHPDKSPGKYRTINSTALHRGYVGTFEIKEVQLFLKDLEIEDGWKRDDRGNPIWKSVMNEVFTNQKLVKIDWISGIFVLPTGGIVGTLPNYRLEAIYENYIVLEIDKGILTKEKQFGYEEYEDFLVKQFESFKKTDEYEELKAKLLKKRWKEEKLDSHIQYQIIEYSTKILVD